mmetsp:Transcript_32586/g.97393  ORF Transcript_32586/g.97393 Transcript_32586/m.97393 type:complete len:249 (+) Transcript_32586:194-940(+)
MQHITKQHHKLASQQTLWCPTSSCHLRRTAGQVLAPVSSLALDPLRPLPWRPQLPRPWCHRQQSYQEVSPLQWLHQQHLGQFLWRPPATTAGAGCLRVSSPLLLLGEGSLRRRERRWFTLLLLSPRHWITTAPTSPLTSLAHTSPLPQPSYATRCGTHGRSSRGADAEKYRPGNSSANGDPGIPLCGLLKDGTAGGLLLLLRLLRAAVRRRRLRSGGLVRGGAVGEEPSSIVTIFIASAACLCRTSLI